MIIDKQDLEAIDKIKRLNIVNAISGLKPANLIGTRSIGGIPNLAIFSSVVHLGSDPALIGFIMRPYKEYRRDTYKNIMQTGHFTINHIHNSFATNAHFTSAKFDANVSEFTECDLNEEKIADFHAPFVKESLIKVGLSFMEAVEIYSNDSLLIVGQIELISIVDHALDGEGHIDLEMTKNVGVSGLNTYYDLKKIETLPYARAEQVPEFK